MIYHSLREMSSTDFRRLQLKCLDMLVYFKDFCDKNGLLFYLAGGSAIGAVRNGGMIPWDEDIDVFMPRPDYEKLSLLWNEKADKSQYLFCRTDKDVNFHHHAGCIMDVTTTYIESKNVNNDIPQGLVMDVIPLDGCGEGMIRRFLQLYNAFLFALFNAQRRPENKNKLIKTMSSFMLAIIRKPDTRYRIWTRAEKKMSKYDFYTSNRITELIGQINGMINTHPTSDFDHAVMVDFEGYKMPLMAGYDRYLSIIFGDYMSLPPDNERHPKSDVECIDLDNCYLNYKGIYYCKQ